MLHNCLGAGYEVRLYISLFRDLEPLKNFLRQLRFFISGLGGHKQPNFFYIPPMIPREVFHVIIGCQTLHFLIKVGVKEKGKYYLYYYMSTTLMKKKIQKFNFSRATGHIFFLDKLNFLGLFLSNIDGGWF